MAINEGIIADDNKTHIKSVMLRQLAHLRETTPDMWERSVFEAMTGHRREDVDWDIADNQAGYYTWIRAFDQLISELEEDGYVQSDDKGGDRKVLRKTEWDPSLVYSQLVYGI